MPARDERITDTTEYSQTTKTFTAHSLHCYSKTSHTRHCCSACRASWPQRFVRRLPASESSCRRASIGMITPSAHQPAAIIRIAASIGVAAYFGVHSRPGVCVLMIVSRIGGASIGRGRGWNVVWAQGGIRRLREWLSCRLRLAVVVADDALIGLPHAKVRQSRDVHYLLGL